MRGYVKFDIRQVSIRFPVDHALEGRRPHEKLPPSSTLRPRTLGTAGAECKEAKEAKEAFVHHDQICQTGS